MYDLPVTSCHARLVKLRFDKLHQQTQSKTITNILYVAVCCMLQSVAICRHSPRQSQVCCMLYVAVCCDHRIYRHSPRQSQVFTLKPLEMIYFHDFMRLLSILSIWLSNRIHPLHGQGQQHTGRFQESVNLQKSFDFPVHNECCDEH